MKKKTNKGKKYYVCAYNSIFVYCFTFQYWRNFFFRIIITLLYSIPNTKACSSYSSRCRGSFVLCILVFLFLYCCCCCCCGCPRSRHFHRCIDLFCCFSLLYTAIILVVAEIILSHVGCFKFSHSLCLFLSFARAHAQKYVHRNQHGFEFDSNGCVVVCIRAVAVAVVTSSASPITFRLFIIRQSHLLHIVCHTVWYSYWLTIYIYIFPFFIFQEGKKWTEEME